jgi:hypothetical protein
LFWRDEDGYMAGFLTAGHQRDEIDDFIGQRGLYD